MLPGSCRTTVLVLYSHHVDRRLLLLLAPHLAPQAAVQVLAVVRIKPSLSALLMWCNRDGSSVRVMTSAESAILMEFPRDWRLPHGSRVSQKAVNALYVEMSKAIMVAAMKAKQDSTLATLTQLTLITNKRSNDDNGT